MVFFGMSENNNIFSDSIHTGPSVHSCPSESISMRASGLIMVLKDESIGSKEPMCCFSFFVVEHENVTSRIGAARRMLRIMMFKAPEDKEKGYTALPCSLFLY